MYHSCKEACCKIGSIFGKQIRSSFSKFWIACRVNKLGKRVEVIREVNGSNLGNRGKVFGEAIPEALRSRVYIFFNANPVLLALNKIFSMWFSIDFIIYIILFQPNNNYSNPMVVIQKLLQSNSKMPSYQQKSYVR